MGVHGQGLVNFNTATLGPSARVFNSSGILASNQLYLAQLFAADGAGQAEGSLQAKGTPVNFRGGNFAGYVQTSGTTSQGNPVVASVAVTTQSAGQVTLQMRAWSSSFSSYAAAVAGGGEFGESDLLNFTPGYPPNTAADLIGLTGFTMVPEPSTVALAVLGAGSLLFLRRRK